MASSIGSNAAIYSLISSHMYINQVLSKTMLGVFKLYFQIYFSYSVWLLFSKPQIHQDLSSFSLPKRQKNVLQQHI